MTVGFMSRFNPIKFKGELPQVSSQMPVEQPQQGPTLSPQQPPADVFTPSSQNTNPQPEQPEGAAPNTANQSPAEAPKA